MKEFEIDLIQFTTGDRKGQHAIVCEYHPVFGITDLEGNLIIEWVADDLMVLEEIDAGQLVAEEHMSDDAIAKARWLDENKYVFVDIPDDVMPKVRQVAERMSSEVLAPLTCSMWVVIGRYTPEPTKED